ncbi:putative helicase [Podospora australis]|uniref:Helicase n=1 Tax=Podospora australis TaxID=1536484 RepID=A0AAN6WXB5_9PEZI|nr:putative helicase [Podospora australis]
MATALEQHLRDWHRELLAFPSDAHWCCPKLHDDDATDYDHPDVPDEPDEDGHGAVSVGEKKQRIKNYEKRFEITYNLSLLMGIEEDRSALIFPEWKEEVEEFLLRCDACIRNWHRGRDKFLKRLPEHLAPEQISFMANCLDQYDKERIDHGLRKGRSLLEKHGPMSTAKLVGLDMDAVLALCEALTSISYLRQNPANLADFDYVFEKTQIKKPLRMQGSLLPAMTSFLFSDSPIRRKFAEAAWVGRAPESLTQEEWYWAVSPGLAAAIQWASIARGGATVGNIRRFWTAFSHILRLLSEKQVIDCLRAMDVTPSIYFLAIEHLTANTEDALAQVLQGLQDLMVKSSKAFWAAFDQLTPSALVEEIFKSPAFRPLLNKSLEPEWMVSEGHVNVPMLAVWMRVFIRSLPLIQRSDACDCILQHLFDTFRQDRSCGIAAQATCTLAGLVALSESLNGYLEQETPFDTGTSLIMVNQLLTKVVQYSEVITTAAGLKPGDTYNVGLSQAAMSIIHSALALDARATEIEWKAVMRNQPVQDAIKRDSGKLWESFLEMLWYGQLGHMELAETMLKAALRVRMTEPLMPERDRKLSSQQENFNRRFHQQTAAIGKMLGRLSDFKQTDLDRFCSEYQGSSLHAIASTLINGQEVIREAGFELMKAVTGEIAPSDAVNKMVEQYFSPFLQAITEAVSKIAANKGPESPWTHMIPILKCSELVLNGLCDPSSGQLRRKSLTKQERELVKSWWESAWKAVQHSFSMMRHWHKKISKKIMEDFCRDVMELANKLFEQDGVLASALSEQGNGADPDNGDATAQAMKVVLGPPRNSSPVIVEMLQLRDKYLIQGIIRVMKQLVTRLKDNGMDLPPAALNLLGRITKPKIAHGSKEYTTKTNLTDEQRIEILKALGEDAVIEELFMGKKPGAKEALVKEQALKQAKLDFSKSALAAALKKDMDDLTPNFEKHRSAMEMLRAESARPKPVKKLEPKAVLATQTSLKEARAREKAEKAKRDAEAIARAKALRAPPKLVAGEGSGLQGIAGVRGKDHAPVIKDEMMVGSSSETEGGSSDDDDDDDEVITLRAKAANQNLNEAERRRLLALAEKKRGPVKKVKLMRSAKDMRARLIPPMDTLHQAILEWDIFHEGNDPPNGYRCAEVSNTYTDPVGYKQTFFPLLINEAWRSFVTSKDETTSKPFGFKISSRMTVDKFMEITAPVPVATSKDRGLSEGDIVLISKSQDPLNHPEEIHCLSRIWKTTYKKDTVEVVLRLNARGMNILPALVPGSEFFAIKITNMTTIEREYAALESLQYYDLMDEVLKAEPSPMLNFGDEAVKGVMDNYQLNPGQAKAILNARENDGFTLVQGPPGTGKTKTIVAMVGCLLTNVLKSSSSNVVNLLRPGAPSKPTGLAKKLLVCAPSNAAVDELVLRLKNGVKTLNGAFHKIEVLRLGRTDAINAGVRDVTLDEMVKARLEADTGNSGPSDREKLHKDAGEIKIKLGELRPQLEAAREGGDRQVINQLQREFDDLKRRQIQIGSRIEADKASGNTFAREVEIKRRQVQQEILDGAHVLCATLSGSGHEMFKNLNVEFETVIIDEAAQCVELSALIPLKYGCSKCILVGDPKQLPPTVLSQSAAKYGYDQSLFVRMQQNHAKDVHLLDTQYRMHPEISKFPSKEFYEGLLQDGAGMAELRLQPWHASVHLGPYRFFDVKGSQSRGPKNQSLVNEEELKVALQLYRRFRIDYGDVDAKGKFGIITPYKAQLHRLKSRFIGEYGENITEDIEFNTTDAFQGRECEIIIFSCVRASPTGGIGFMTDIRRMNVGLTRAKSSLWILGDSRALVQGEFWAKLIEDARQRDLYTSGNILALLDRPGQRAPGFAPGQGYGGSARASRSSTTYRNSVSDVEMTDAPPAALPYRGPVLGGINERGEAMGVVSNDGMPPIIKTTSGSTGKKRARDGSDDSRATKKKTQPSMNGPPPVMPRAHKVKPPIDPSAMEVLGLIPPERPPPPPQQSRGPQPPPNRPPGGPRQPPRPPMPPHRKQTVDPFIKRKPPPKR